MLIGVTLMTLATYLTRILGVWAMHYVPITPWVQKFLSGMANTVLVAVVAPYAWEGDWPMRVGIAVAVLVMALTRRTVVAMLVGVIVTAALRAL